MTRSRYKIFEVDHPHFLTCTIVGWLPVFTRNETVQIIFDSWLYLQEQRGISIYGYVILENHLHMIAGGPDLAEAIGDFKSFTARRIIDFLEEHRASTILEQLKWHKARHKQDRTYQLWQEGSHPQDIPHETIMWQKLEYIHNNPVQRGYVDEPIHWRWSSARDYAGLTGLFPVKTDWCRAA
jgi:REP element-mobilizing transposase RayT